MPQSGTRKREYMREEATLPKRVPLPSLYQCSSVQPGQIRISVLNSVQPELDIISGRLDATFTS